MLVFLLRRLLQSFAALLIISALVFVMMYCVADPVATLLPPTATQQHRQQLAAQLGLDRPLWVQYARFLTRLGHGDLGYSYYSGRPVTGELIERIPATAELAVVALLLAALVGLPLGVMAAARPRSWISRLCMGGSLVGISIPSFWLGLLLMMTLSVRLGWLPVGERGQTRALLGAQWSVLTADGWRHLILPAVTMASYHLAILMRLMRAQMSQTLAQPFIRVCRARGLGPWAIVGRHALRNTLIPIVTVLGLQLGGLLAFSVVTETVFNWPGLGKLLIDRVQVDRPLVVAYLMMTGVVFLAINFTVDVAYAWIDPRIRWARRES